MPTIQGWKMSYGDIGGELHRPAKGHHTPDKPPDEPYTPVKPRKKRKKRKKPRKPKGKKPKYRRPRKWYRTPKFPGQKYLPNPFKPTPNPGILGVLPWMSKLPWI